MRHKKGSKVEVLSKNKVPSSSWRSAEVLSGDGHDYTVRYDMYTGTAEGENVERVSRKSIRPCPPMVELSDDWIPGDVVEVFHNFSWKMATVSMVYDGNYFVVRLLGSSQEVKVSKFDIRVRQSWQDNKWIIIGKGSGNCENDKCNERSALMDNRGLSSQVKQADTRMNCVAKNVFAAIKSGIKFQDSHMIPSRNLKRKSANCYSRVEAHAGTARKLRMVEKKGMHYRTFPTNASSSYIEVDTIAPPGKLLGEKHTFDSFNNRKTRLSEMDYKREKPNQAVGCSNAVSLEPNDADNVTCSVGSCSITSNNASKLPCRFSMGPAEDTDYHFNDAESVCRSGYEEGTYFPPTKEELAAEIHKLELHAYRCTMEALHASGPLSWEQETLVTNLRLLLHISNDEHLMELRNLISTVTSIPIR